MIESWIEKQTNKKSIRDFHDNRGNGNYSVYIWLYYQIGVNFLKHSNDIVFIKTMFFCLRYPWGGNVRDIVCLLLNAFTFLTQEEKNIGIVWGTYLRTTVAEQCTPHSCIERFVVLLTF